MQQVSSIAEKSEAASQTVLSVAAGVGKTAETLRGEVQQFLSAMANSTESDRDRYKRSA